MVDSDKPKYPPGFRFVPKDEELILNYLQLKIDNQPIPLDEITEVDLYANNPKVLAEECPSLGENEWYFFTPRERKYRNGSRPKRSAENGYWKATGSDKPIYSEDRVVGLKKSLVFYQGLPQKGTKTDWIMHEYRVDMPPRIRSNASDMKLDDWVLCRIYKKAASKSKNKNRTSNHNVTPSASSDNLTASDQVDPTDHHVASTDPIAPTYQSPLQVFEEQGQEIDLQGGFEEPLMPLVAPSESHYSNHDTQLVDNIGEVYIDKNELVDDRVSDSLQDSWYNNLDALMINENRYYNNGYGIEQLEAYWPPLYHQQHHHGEWTSNLVTQVNDGDFNSSNLLQINNNGTFLSSSASRVENCWSFQGSSLGNGSNYSVDSSMKSEALINPDYNQVNPRKRLRS